MTKGRDRWKGEHVVLEERDDADSSAKDGDTHSGQRDGTRGDGTTGRCGRSRAGS